MKITLNWALVAMLACCTSGIARADEIDSLIDLWKAKKYDDVLPRLLAYRKTPTGRTWRVDYLIGTCQCHAPKDTRAGIGYLNNVLIYKDVPDKARETAQLEIQFCRNAAAVASPQEQPSFELVAVSGQFTEPAGVSGKGGYNHISDSKSVTSSKANVVPVSLDELRKRVFAEDQGAEALRAAQTRMGGGPPGVVANGFVVVCSRGCAQEVSRQVAECLARYQTPLKQQFDISRPGKLITVYVPAELHEVPEYAQRLHGVQLPLGTLAYSVREDLSIVGLMNEGSCGSLAHELVHLSIKGNFGDSPAWLEEGLASEVAVGAPRTQGFGFGPSWRDQTLRKQMSKRPHVAELLGMSWSDFAALDPSSLDKVAATHAMAAVLVRYLDARKKLSGVYYAIRDGRFPEDGGEPRTDLSIVEQQLGSNAAAIDADFVKWFDSQPH